MSLGSRDSKSALIFQNIFFLFGLYTVVINERVSVSEISMVSDVKKLFRKSSNVLFIPVEMCPCEKCIVLSSVLNTSQ